MKLEGANLGLRSDLVFGPAEGNQATHPVDLIMHYARDNVSATSSAKGDSVEFETASCSITVIFCFLPCVLSRIFY